MGMFAKLLLISSFFVFNNISYAKKMEVIKEHSKINFNVDYLKISSVEGSFSEFYGTFEMDGPETEISNINVVITSKSVNTRDGKRDYHLKGHEFLFVSSFPEITFKSNDKILLKTNQRIKIVGEINIRGVKKIVIFEGIYKGKIIDPWKKENYFFELESKINRKDFNIVWNKELDGGGFLVGDEVRMKLIIQAQNAGNKTSFSTHMIPSTKGIIERDQLKKGKIKKLSTSTEVH